MKYVIKPHAKKRMKERAISDSVLQDALEYPTKIGYDANGRMMFKKVYRKAGEDRLLLIIGENKGEIFEIITVIDTSKVKKYL